MVVWPYIEFGPLIGLMRSDEGLSCPLVSIEPFGGPFIAMKLVLGLCDTIWPYVEWFDE